MCGRLFLRTTTMATGCNISRFPPQALTNIDKLNSRPSDPLLVTWPGVQPPTLRRAPAVSQNAVRVAWEPPLLTDGVKLKQFKVSRKQRANHFACFTLCPNGHFGNAHKSMNSASKKTTTKTKNVAFEVFQFPALELFCKQQARRGAAIS